MAHMLRLLTFSFLLMVVAPFSQALAAPYTYQTTSGGLTGTWTTEPPNPRVGHWLVLSFNITPPLGEVWDSRDPSLFYFEKQNFGSGVALQVHRTNPNTTDGLPYLLFTTSGPTNSDPNMRLGTYEFEIQGIGGLNAGGTGEWKLVPIPDMLWPTFVGLLGLAFFMEQRRRHVHLVR